ncbi:MAG: peptidoglycan editing factor PgeF [Alphaproteobacteria bacterium]|jgi:YfiH family protein|tara:strand:+ start:31066 stop:31821 length:756 start_codon:yes stop_codon:yes gene_type:complete
MITSSLLKQDAMCQHLFFTRYNGFSKGLYSSLNCSYNSNDNKNIIKKNRTFVAEKFNLKETKLIVTKQGHSNKCVVIKHSHDKNIVADAMVTSSRNIGLGILTADCVPILIMDTKNQVIGAIHAGWKGASTGVIENTIKKMISIGGNTRTMIAAIGPSIQQRSYEVGEEFKKYFIDLNPYNEELFIRADSGKIYFDLTKYCKKKLYNLLLSKIDLLDYCTYQDSKEFFSYRRSCHNNEVDYGRQISVISLL